MLSSYQNVEFLGWMNMHCEMFCLFFFQKYFTNLHTGPQSGKDPVILCPREAQLLSDSLPSNLEMEVIQSKKLL